MNTSELNTFSVMSKHYQILFGMISFLIVAFGQPAWSPLLSILAASVGYTLFFRVLLCYSNHWHRFWLTTGWFFAVQLVQLSWSISHPYYYIYFVYIALSFLLGLQFGFVGLLITAKRMTTFGGIMTVASLWTLIEWSRLFFLTGFTWNPSGLALSGNLYSMQMASIWGVFGLSFWVIFVNLLALQAWLKGLARIPLLIWVIGATLPYVYGIIHITVHHSAFEKNDSFKDSRFNALLVQTAFPVEEAMDFSNTKNMTHYVLNEWRQILGIIKRHRQQNIDLIALPEFLVPFGTYSFVYPHETVKRIFEDTIGPGSLWALPPLETPLANFDGTKWLVNNAYWAQTIANYFQTELVAGLEDAEDINGQREYYSAALFFKPQKSEGKRDRLPFAVERYEKRVLVPMGEYIPLDFLKELAADYGITGSFTPGNAPKIMSCRKIPFGVSICYEETFGNLMRQNKHSGAQLLVNLTSDVWYPNSRLPKQHWDHACLRTVENGIPLIRSCNTGITGAIDSLGRTVAVLGGDNPEAVEWVPDALFVKVPTYTYSTLYSRLGDGLIIGFCFCTVFLTACLGRWKKTQPVPSPLLLEEDKQK